MTQQHPNSLQNLALASVLLIAALLGCNPGPPQPVQPTQPSQNFNFAVSVRDRDKQNRPIGQATVLVEVGNETVAQEVTDDNGQANFSVASVYLGKSARLFARAHEYHSADLVLVLRNDTRQTIQMVSTDAPKLEPDPVEPSPAPGVTPARTPKKEPPPNLEPFVAGESKTGMIADRQVIDYRFEANKNQPLIFKARVPDGDTHFAIEIYDSQGFPQKDLYVSYTSEMSLPFTPPETGTFILRLRGRKNFGRYLVSMQEL